MTAAPTMRASFLDAPRTLAVRRVPLPVVRAGDVLVRIEAVGLCGSDVHFFEHGRVGDLVVQAPLILGHEAAGVITAVGEGVEPARIGERVAVEPQRHCRDCIACVTGRYNLCERMQFASAPPTHGAFAEFMAVPGMFAHPIPSSLSFEHAALAEPLSVGIAAMRKAGVVPGTRVLVAGAGPIGVLAGAAARAFGASEVVVVDPLEGRRAIARSLGATRVVAPGEDAGAGFDAFVDASGAPAAIGDGLYALRRGGRAVLVGMGSERIDLDLFRVQSFELELYGLFRYANTWPLAIELIASGRVDVSALVTDRFPLDRLDEAMGSNGDPQTMKLIVMPAIADERPDHPREDPNR